MNTKLILYCNNITIVEVQSHTSNTLALVEICLSDSSNYQGCDNSPLALIHILIIASETRVNLISKFVQLNSRVDTLEVSF